MSLRTLASALGVGALAALVAAAGLELRGGNAGLAPAVAAQAEASGVLHPVTAVLLNFRSYDTWLELIVLVIAATGALQGRLQAAPLESRLAGDPLAAWLLTALIPLTVLAAGYLLESGAYAPGGAFQAGAVLAATLVLLHLTGRRTLTALPTALVRVGLVLGAAVFALAAAAGLVLENALLAYPPALAGAVIVAIESAATISIAIALAALVTGQIER